MSESRHLTIAVAERATISGNVGDDVRVAGRRVDVAGTVGGHMVAAGSEVTVDAASRIADWAWLAGQRIDVRGTIGADLKAAGQTIIIAGRIEGDADLVGRTLRIEPGASRRKRAG